MIENLDDNQICYLNKLKNLFDTVSNYLGDDDLISSCNDEYKFDHNDVIRTDGSIITSMEPVTMKMGYREEECIELTTAIRGATYIIVADAPVKGSAERKYHLYLDNPYIIPKYEEIVHQLSMMKQCMDSVDYYQKEWRGTVIPNQYVIDEIRYIND